MYDLCTCLANTYMHTKKLINNMLSCIFRPHVRVCRLILKKFALVFQMPLLQVPSNSLASPM